MNNIWLCIKILPWIAMLLRNKINNCILVMKLHIFSYTCFWNKPTFRVNMGFTEFFCVVYWVFIGTKHKYKKVGLLALEYFWGLIILNFCWSFNFLYLNLSSECASNETINQFICIYLIIYLWQIYAIIKNVKKK